MRSDILLTTPLFDASEMADILSEALAISDKSDGGKVSVGDVLHCILIQIEENLYHQVQTAIRDVRSPYRYSA
jgi:hypothetical protein